MHNPIKKILAAAAVLLGIASPSVWAQSNFTVPANATSTVITYAGNWECPDSWFQQPNGGVGATLTQVTIRKNGAVVAQSSVTPAAGETGNQPLASPGSTTYSWSFTDQVMYAGLLTKFASVAVTWTLSATELPPGNYTIQLTTPNVNGGIYAAVPTGETPPPIPTSYYNITDRK